MGMRTGGYRVYKLSLGEIKSQATAAANSSQQWSSAEGDGGSVRREMVGAELGHLHSKGYISIKKQLSRHLDSAGP